MVGAYAARWESVRFGIRGGDNLLLARFDEVEPTHLAAEYQKFDVV